jgi:hemerythrin superfamily protein
MKATTMIRMDHTHVLALFHRFKPDASVGKKRALVANACLALDIHAQLEEEFFYPALREVIAGDETLEKSKPEHDDMRLLIAELRERAVAEDPVAENPIEGAAFDAKFNDLMRIVIHHVADEETRLLPAAERLMNDRLAQLGSAMMKRRIELLRPHMGELAASTMRSFPSAAAAGILVAAGAVAVGAMLLTRRGDTRPH